MQTELFIIPARYDLCKYTKITDVDLLPEVEEDIPLGADFQIMVAVVFMPYHG